jgi:tetratricopeptide (TPR) repeat protein
MPRERAAVSQRRSTKSAADAEKPFLKLTALRDRAQRLESGGRYAEAEAALRQALQLAERSRLLQPIDLAGLLNDYGVVCKYAGHLKFAEKLYRRALKLAGTRPSGNEKLLATLYHNLGGIEHASRRYALAMRHARRGIRIRNLIRPRDTIAIAADEAALGAILTELQRNSEARTVLSRALRGFRHSLGPKHYEVGAVLANIGALHLNAGRPGAAERALRSAVAILEKTIGVNHPRLASALNNLGVVCARREKFAEAAELYRRALRLLKGDARSSPPGAALVRANLNATLRPGC